MADNIHGFSKSTYSEKAMKIRKKSPKFFKRYRYCENATKI